MGIKKGKLYYEWILPECQEQGREGQFYLNVKSKAEKVDYDFLSSHLNGQQCHGAVKGLQVVHTIRLQLDVLQNMPVELHATLNEQSSMHTDHGFCSHECADRTARCFRWIMWRTHKEYRETKRDADVQKTKQTVSIRFYNSNLMAKFLFSANVNRTACFRFPITEPCALCLPTNAFITGQTCVLSSSLKIWYLLHEKDVLSGTFLHSQLQGGNVTAQSAT